MDQFPFLVLPLFSSVFFLLLQRISGSLFIFDFSIATQNVRLVNSCYRAHSHGMGGPVLWICTQNHQSPSAIQRVGLRDGTTRFVIVLVSPPEHHDVAEVVHLF
jgi:hypothetical protein